jgi:hypothetical protein
VGNVYVGGLTASPDFTVTSPRIGPQGTSNAFAAEFSAGGSLIYSVVIGGESRDTVTGFAVDSSGEAHLAGWTISDAFPTTQSAFATVPGENNAFALKLGHSGEVIYSSYLPGFAAISSYAPPTVAVAVEASGTALFGGPGGQISRMSADGSGFTSVSTQPGPIYKMVSDAQGNIYVAGQSGGSPANAQMLCASGDSTNLAFLSKLQPDTLQQSYRKWIGNCPTKPSILQVSPAGEAMLSFSTFSTTLPLLNPLLLASGCPANGAPAIVRLGADGSTTLFSSYLDTCLQPPVIAVAPDGSTYAGVTSFYWKPGGTGVAILRIPAPKAESPAITGMFNAFSGAVASAAPGMLLTITGARLSSGSIDLGLSDPNPLPMNLAMSDVLFERVPARILQVTPEFVICVVPEIPSGRQFVSVQLQMLSVARPRDDLSVADEFELSPPTHAPPITLPVTLPVQGNVGLLTTEFPAVPTAAVVQGNIRNADGTLNSPQNRAAPGSTVTIYATGVNQPGSIGLYWDSEPPPPAFLLIQRAGRWANSSPTPG